MKQRDVVLASRRPAAVDFTTQKRYILRTSRDTYDGIVVILLIIILKIITIPVITIRTTTITRTSIVIG